MHTFATTVTVVKKLAENKADNYTSCVNKNVLAKKGFPLKFYAAQQLKIITAT